MRTNTLTPRERDCLGLVTTSGDLPRSGTAEVETITDVPEFVARAFASTRTQTGMAHTSSSDPTTKRGRLTEKVMVKSE